MQVFAKITRLVGGLIVRHGGFSLLGMMLKS